MELFDDDWRYTTPFLSSFDFVYFYFLKYISIYLLFIYYLFIIYLLFIYYLFIIYLLFIYYLFIYLLSTLLLPLLTLAPGSVICT